MPRLLRLLVGALLSCARSRRDLLLENLALRQLFTVLTIRHPKPQLAAPVVD
jgi:hypothetical protein